jgi:hypothetical protein
VLAGLAPSSQTVGSNKERTGPNVIKLFMGVIYIISLSARVFVIGKLFHSILTNTLT